MERIEKSRPSGRASQPHLLADLPAQMHARAHHEQNRIQHRRPEHPRPWNVSDLVHINLATAAVLTIILAEVEANTTLFLSTISVRLVDLGALGQLAVGFE